MIFDPHPNIFSIYLSLIPNIDERIDVQFLKNGDYLINIEQLSRKEILDIMKLYKVPIIDYSYTNKKILDKIYFVFPFIYDRKLMYNYNYNHKNISDPNNLILENKCISSIHEKIYDVCFFGVISPRRKFIISKLQSVGLKVFFSSNIFGDEMNKIIMKSKILLNIHYDHNYKIFEFLRCMQPLYNKIIILSEETDISSEIGIYEYCLKFVIFEKYENIISKASSICKCDNLCDMYQNKYDNLDYDELENLSNFHIQEFKEKMTLNINNFSISSINYDIVSFRNVIFSKITKGLKISNISNNSNISNDYIDFYKSGEAIKLEKGKEIRNLFWLLPKKNVGYIDNLIKEFNGYKCIGIGDTCVVFENGNRVIKVYKNTLFDYDRYRKISINKGNQIQLQKISDYKMIDDNIIVWVDKLEIGVKPKAKDVLLLNKNLLEQNLFVSDVIFKNFGYNRYNRIFFTDISDIQEFKPDRWKMLCKYLEIRYDNGKIPSSKDECIRMINEII